MARSPRVFQNGVRHATCADGYLGLIALDGSSAALQHCVALKLNSLAWACRTGIIGRRRFVVLQNGGTAFANSPRRNVRAPCSAPSPLRASSQVGRLQANPGESISCLPLRCYFGDRQDFNSRALTRIPSSSERGAIMGNRKRVKNRKRFFSARAETGTQLESQTCCVPGSSPLRPRFQPVSSPRQGSRQGPCAHHAGRTK